MTAGAGVGLAPSLRPGSGELTGAVADLGVFVPLVAALVLVVGLDAGAVLLLAGLLLIGAGLRFGIPFPVQPLKALTAVAVAEQLSADTVHAAGLLIGGVLLLLTVRRVADALARAFTPVVVRALQHGVGVLLMVAAVRLVVDPPAVFQASPPPPWPLLLAGAGVLVVAWAAHRGRPLFGAALLLVGLTATVLVVQPSLPAPTLQLPDVAMPDAGAFATAFVLLVVPQIPLTFGNAVVAVGDVARRYFGGRAAAVTPARVCRSAGLANIASALLGGMPMCHGSGGLTAHYRLGARTAGMNLLLGGAFVVLGVGFAPHVLSLLGLLPVWALAAFLCYAGMRHALLVADQRGAGLVTAVGAGLLGAVLGNLAVTMVVALAADRARTAVRAQPKPASPVQ